MSIQKILAISGKPGLYELKIQTRTGFVAESFLDGKKITKKELSKIETHKIKSVNVIKKPSEIAKYTSDSFEGVIIIDLKK